MKNIMMRGIVVAALIPLLFCAVSCSDNSVSEPSQTVANHKLMPSEEQMIFTGDNRTDEAIYNIELGYADGSMQLLDLPPGLLKFPIASNVTRVVVNGMALPQGAAVPIMSPNGRTIFAKWSGNSVVVTDDNEVN